MSARGRAAPTRLVASLALAAALLLAPGGAFAIDILSQFEGLSAADDTAVLGGAPMPPDHGLGAGPSHIFQMVNSVGRVTDKQGRIVSGPFSLRSFFSLDASGESDPRVIYDTISGRWFATYFQYSASSSSIVLAVSTTSSATGTFCTYRLGDLLLSETFMQDFPMIGVSDDKVVVSYNGFNLSTNTFIGGGFYVVNKAQAVACLAITFDRFPPSTSFFTLHPAQSLSSTSDLFMVQNNYHVGASGITIVRVSGVPGVGGGVSTTPTPIGMPGGTWSPPPKALQAGSSVQLDASDGRVTSASWRNSSLWLAGSESCTPSGDTAVRSCLRVIEVRTDSMTIRQNITFGSVGKYYYHPAVVTDSSGNLGVAFTRSSATDFASVWVTGRQASDALGTLQTAAQLRGGAGAQTDSSGRMGDYSGAAVDPSDPTKIWLGAEYIRSTAPRDWGTSIGQVTLVPALAVSGRAPAVSSWAPGRLDVFMRGPDNTLRHKFFEGAWSGWEDLGGYLLSDPGVVSWGPGRIDVFARGLDDAIWHKFYENGWSEWESLGGATFSRPAVASWAPGRLDLFVRGTDGQMWHRFFEGGWSGWEPLGGVLASEPATVSFGVGRIDVFVQGIDSVLYQKFFDFANHGWFDWRAHGGVLSSAPAVSSWGPGRLDVFVRGSDGNLWHLWFDNALTSDMWEALGDAIATAPAAVSWDFFRIDLFAGRADGTLLHKWFDGTWNSEVQDAPL